MKRPLNFWDGCALILIFLKLSGMRDFPTWHIFLPWIMESISSTILIAFKTFGIYAKMVESATRILVKIKVWQIKRSLKK